MEEVQSLGRSGKEAGMRRGGQASPAGSAMELLGRRLNHRSTASSELLWARPGPHLEEVHLGSWHLLLDLLQRPACSVAGPRSSRPADWSARRQ